MFIWRIYYYQGFCAIKSFIAVNCNLLKYSAAEKQASLTKPRTCTIKHYGLIMYEFDNKLVCLWLTLEKTLAYYKIC